jgi:hypothetical protein
MGGPGSGRKRDPARWRKAVDLRTRGLSLPPIGRPWFTLVLHEDPCSDGRGSAPPRADSIGWRLTAAGPQSRV